MAIIYKGSDTSRLNTIPGPRLSEEIPPDCCKVGALLYFKIMSSRNDIRSLGKRAAMSDKKALASIARDREFIKELEESVFQHLIQCNKCTNSNIKENNNG